jgi:hypothetical protein
LPLITTEERKVALKEHYVHAILNVSALNYTKKNKRIMATL